LFALLRVHGYALLALQRDEKEARDWMIRAIFTENKMMEKQVKKRRQAAAKNKKEQH